MRFWVGNQGKGVKEGEEIMVLMLMLMVVLRGTFWDISTLGSASGGF